MGSDGFSLVPMVFRWGLFGSVQFDRFCWVLVGSHGLLGGVFISVRFGWVLSGSGGF